MLFDDHIAMSKYDFRLAQCQCCQPQHRRSSGGACSHAELCQSKPGLGLRSRVPPPPLPQRPRSSWPNSFRSPFIMNSHPVSNDAQPSSEPINFRAALATFQGQSSSNTGANIHTPTPRSSRSTSRNLNQDPTSSSERWWMSQDPSHHDPSTFRDPVPRSSSTPKIRNDPSPSTTSHLDPCSQQGAISTPTSAIEFSSNQLHPSWPTLAVGNSSSASRLRKSESGTSLHELVQKSLPDQAVNRNRSKSLAGRSSNSSSRSGYSTPSAVQTPSASERSSPRLGVKGIIALYGGPTQGHVSAAASSSYGVVRTSSPMSIASTTSARGRHMLDPSNDDALLDPLANHVILQPTISPSGLSSASASHPSSPERKNHNSALAAFSLFGQKAPESFPAPADTPTHATKLPSRVMLQRPTPSHNASSSSLASVASSQQTFSSSSSSSSSANLPRIPPRPSFTPTLNTSINEFGQLSSAGNPAALESATSASYVPYATYTPGLKRHVSSPGENHRSPPALPPRSATLGQTARQDSQPISNKPSLTRGSAQDPLLPYVVRQRSPIRPNQKSPLSFPHGLPADSSSPAAKPEPPPRPTQTPLHESYSPKPSQNSLDGNAGGFKFGGSPVSGSASGKPLPPPRMRPQNVAHHRGMLGSMSSDPSSSISRPRRHGHLKTSSNVFTSISLSDDASHDLRQSLETDMLQRGNLTSSDTVSLDILSPSTMSHNPAAPCHPPPPVRARVLSNPARHHHSTTNNNTAATTPSSSLSPNQSQISALWETATASLPGPLKSIGNAGRALIESSTSSGLPVKPMQPPRIVSGSNLGDPNLISRPGWAGQMSTRTVFLADPVVKTPLRFSRSVEPADSAARRRYEIAFDGYIAAQADSRKKNKIKKPIPKKTGNGEISLSQVTQQNDRAQPGSGRGNVGSLRGWFESDVRAAEKPTAAKSAMSLFDTSQDSLYQGDARKAETCLSFNRVAKIWRKSRLSDHVLSQVWEAAVQHQLSAKRPAQSTMVRGLEKEPFVRAMAAIDAELTRRATKRRGKSLQPHHEPIHKQRSPLNDGGLDWSAASRLPRAAISSINSLSRDGSFASVNMMADGAKVHRVVSDSCNLGHNSSNHLFSSSSSSTATAMGTPGTRRLPPPPPPSTQAGL